MDLTFLPFFRSFFTILIFNAFLFWHVKYQCTSRREKKVRHVPLPIVKFSHDGSIVSIYLERIVRFRLYIISFMNMLTRPINLQKKRRRILLPSKCSDGSVCQHMVYKFIPVLHYINIPISCNVLCRNEERIKIQQH